MNHDSAFNYIDKAEERLEVATRSFRSGVAKRIAALRKENSCTSLRPLRAIPGLIYLEQFDGELGEVVMVVYDLAEKKAIRSIRFEDISQEGDSMIVEILPSFDGRKVAVMVSVAGSASNSINVYGEVDTGDPQLIGRLENIRSMHVVWSGDSSSLVIVHHEPEREWGISTWNPATENLTPWVVEPKRFDGRTVLLYSERGMRDVGLISSAIDGLNGEVWFRDLETGHESEGISFRETQIFPVGIDSRGDLWNREVTPDEIRLQRRTEAGWITEFVIEGAYKLYDSCLVDDVFFLAVVTGARGMVLRYTVDGKRLDEFRCPVGSGVMDMFPIPESGSVLFEMISCISCRSLWLLSHEGDPVRFDGAAPSPGRSWEGLAVALRSVPADDGIEIPITVIEKSGEENQRGCVVWVYGGYGVGYPNYRHPLFLLLAEHGLTSLIAHVRGGGENGIGWQLAGRGLRRQRTLDDLAAVLAWAGKRYGRVGLYGESYGAMVALTSALQSPELSQAVVCISGPYNLERSPDFVSGRLHLEINGDPRVEEEWKIMRTYSPAHIPLDSTDYPDILLIADRDDDTVDVSYTEEMVTRLGSAEPEIPIYVRLSEGKGHFNLGPEGLDVRNVDVVSFYLSRLR